MQNISVHSYINYMWFTNFASPSKDAHFTIIKVNDDRLCSTFKTDDCKYLVLTLVAFVLSVIYKPT